MALAETSRGKLCAALTQVSGLRPESAESAALGEITMVPNSHIR